MAAASAPGGGGPAAAWAPRTKLRRPDAAPDLELRPELLAAVRAAVRATPVTLVSAQAGAGKTTLAATVAADPDLPTAWITLDPGDDDVASVLYLLGLAIGSVIPGGCPALLDLVGSSLPAALDPRRAAGVLINDVLAADPPPFLVVLDDLHAITDPAAFQALDYLVANAPPVLHLLVTSRRDPPLALSRLRATRRLAEVRGEDLRLDAPMTDRFLNGRLGLDLRPEAVEAVVARAAGWAAGIQLLGRSLKQGAVAGGPADGDASTLYAYLADEIVADQPDDLQRLLEDTCVLAELTPQACQLLAGRPDAAEVVAGLHRRLHFLVERVDAETGVYRYHDLFAGFLRRRLSARNPARLAVLHRLAADVVGDQGRRLEHLLAAGAVEEAADVVEQLGRAAVTDTASLRRCTTWIARLPEDLVARRRWLQLLVAVADVTKGQHGPSAAPLEAVLGPFEAADDLLGQWTAARHLHLVTSDHVRFGPLLGRLSADPRFSDLPPAVRVEQAISQTYGAMYQQRWDDAALHLRAAIELTTRSADSASVESLARHLSPLLAVIDGAGDRIEAFAAWVDSRTPPGPSLRRLGVFHQVAFTAFLRGRFTSALKAAGSGRVVLERLGGQPFLRTTFDWVTAAGHFARGELAQAEALLRNRQDEAPVTDLDASMNGLQLPLWLRTLRAQGRLAEVARIAKESVPGGLMTMSPDNRALVVGAFQAQAALAAGDLGAAVDLLRRAAAIEDDIRLVPGTGSPRLDLAVVLWEADRPTEAWTELVHALGVAEARGMPGLIAQAGAAVIPLLRMALDRHEATATATAALDALGERPRPAPLAVPGSPEVLSPREVEVLSLLVEGATNRQIAEGLFISEHTAKSHVRHLLTKLGVSSRALAVARARDEHLV